ncbi:AMP-binding protein [Aestuariivirga sp.]|uniref:AMP-binding protein n=1 Tax=Aestuariivirga sp. TaxID=2650926 RepID=UPI00391D80B8
MSYADVRAQIDTLLPRFAGERRLVALEAWASAQFIIAYLAALKAGQPVALLPPGKADLRDAFHKDFQPALSFSMQAGRWTMVEHGTRLGAEMHRDLALMLATSGSEGRPRWVRLSRANIEANAASIVTYLGLTSSDRLPHTLPLHYSYGLSTLNSHLAAGGSLAFCGESVADPDFLRTAASLGSTGLSGVPFTYELLERLAFRSRMWPGLRYMTVAGGRLSPDLVKLYDVALRRHGGCFFAMYGQTEATARMAYLPPELVRTHADCIGIAIPGGHLRIRDEAGCSITGVGEKGELVYRGPNVMMGYATRREDLARGAELAELATGDIATQTTEGLFRLEGRASRFSKIAGIRVGHEAIEWALRSKGISCAVTGSDESIAVHVEGSAGNVIPALAADAAGMPLRFVRLQTHQELPRLPSGKIDYKALEKAAPPSAPSSAKDLIQDFQAAFYPKKVSAGDSFESLEGDSLAYVQTSLAVENRLGFLPENWEQIPIGQLEKQRSSLPAAESRRTSKVESHLFLRAAAILLIVVHHATLWPIPGGAAVLMMMVGYGFARFHSEQLFSGRVGAFLLPMFRNLLPYFVIVAGFTVVWEKLPWASALLIGNLGFADPGDHTMLPFQFWFVEAYVQICLMTALSFSVPAVQRLAAKHPFEVALGVLLFAFALRYAVPLVYDIGNRKIFFPTYVLWLVALGWCAYFVDSTARRAALLLTAALLCPFAAYTGGNWQGSWTLYMLQLSVLFILVLVPSLRLPRFSIPAVTLISAGSYHIYLFHRIVPESLGLDTRGLFGIFASVVIGLVTGIGAMSLQRLIFARLGSTVAMNRRLVANRAAGPLIGSDDRPILNE